MNDKMMKEKMNEKIEKYKNEIIKLEKKVNHNIFNLKQIISIYINIILLKEVRY